MSERFAEEDEAAARIIKELEALNAPLPPPSPDISLLPLSEEEEEEGGGDVKVEDVKAEAMQDECRKSLEHYRGIRCDDEDTANTESCAAACEDVHRDCAEAQARATCAPERKEDKEKKEEEERKEVEEREEGAPRGKRRSLALAVAGGAAVAAGAVGSAATAAFYLRRMRLRQEHVANLASTALGRVARMDFYLHRKTRTERSKLLRELQHLKVDLAELAQI